MIIPEPESDLSLNIMVIAADIIRFLNKNKDYVLVDNVMKEFVKRDNRRTPEMFFNALTFLYSLDIIKEQGYKMRLEKNGNTQTTLL